MKTQPDPPKMRHCGLVLLGPGRLVTSVSTEDTPAFKIEKWRHKEEVQII
jgi:hypothetical protein